MKHWNQTLEKFLVGAALMVLLWLIVVHGVGAQGRRGHLAPRERVPTLRTKAWKVAELPGCNVSAFQGCWEAASRALPS